MSKYQGTAVCWLWSSCRSSVVHGLFAVCW